MTARLMSGADSATASDEIIFHTGYWEPIVIRRNGMMVYSMPVDSGHQSFVVETPIIEADYAVLTTDDERFLKLFAVLHQPCQLARTTPDAKEMREYFDIMLHAPKWRMDALTQTLKYVAYAYRSLLAAREFGRSVEPIGPLR